MPVINILRDELFKAIDRTLTDDEFSDLCFAFGIELDAVTSERERVIKEIGEEAAASMNLSDEATYKIEIPANRYDLLCLEGLSQALRVFLGIDKEIPNYTVSGKPVTTLIVKPASKRIRQYCIAAVLRGIEFNESRYRSFIELQEKLHQNICRERTLVSVGTHDLDTVQQPFIYTAEAPDAIRFVPLKEEKEFTAESLFRYYDEEKQQTPLRKYLHIIRDSPVYPVIYDANGIVCSLPPIINGEHSKITLKTKNVFIEVTAVDLTKANIVLDIICCMFGRYCQAIEPVKVVNEETGENLVYPNLGTYEFDVDIARLCKNIGISIDRGTAMKLLHRMQVPSLILDDREGAMHLRTIALPIRPDILHACDIEEDLAISYGFNNVVHSKPKTWTVGRQQPLNKLSDLLRGVIVEAGFTEVLTWSLISHENNFANMLIEPYECVVLGEGRKIREFEILRTSLIPGLLMTLGHNRGKMPLPVSIFEVSDVVLLDEGNECGASNQRRIAAAYCGKTSGFEIVHGLLDRIMVTNRFGFEDQKEEGIKLYRLEPCNIPSYFPGMQASIILDGKNIGNMGVVHPKVLANFHIDAPCSVIELNAHAFL